MKKIVIFFMFFIAIFGCKSKKAWYYDKEKRSKVYYKNEYRGCKIFRKTFLTGASGYNPYKCMEVKYGFTQKDYLRLRRLCRNIKVEMRKNTNYYELVSRTNLYLMKASDNEGTLVNKEGFGLFEIYDSNFMYFYILRTEDGFFFYRYCYERKKLFDKLKQSKKINKNLKMKIQSYIENFCLRRNEFIQFPGRWY